MSDFSKRLPYLLPKSENEALVQLGQVLRMQTEKLKGEPRTVIIALSGTILYRHLDRLNKSSVLELIHALGHGPLKEELITKCVDSLINAQWTEWSLTTQKLEEIINFHNTANRISGTLGANPGAYGVGGSAWSIIKQGASKGNIAVLAASIAIMGLHEFSYRETQRYTIELDRRKSFVGGH